MRSTDNGGWGSQSLSQTSLCLLPSFIVCNINFCEAVQSKQSQLHFTRPHHAPLLPESPLHDTHKPCDTQKSPHSRLALFSRPPADHTPTRPHLRNYTTFAPQVRTTHTIESSNGSRPHITSRYLVDASRFRLGHPRQLACLCSGLL